MVTIAPIPPAYRIEADSLCFPTPDHDAPVMVLILDSSALAMATLILPPCPLIGIGPADHPLAPYCDVRVDTAQDAAPIIAAIEAQPEAAAVLVQLLRLIADMPLDQALVAESLAYGLLQGSAAHGEWLSRQMPTPADPPGQIVLTREGDALTILIDRPHARNAIDRAMRDGLREAFEFAALDTSITSVTLRGAGKAFCVGADLSEFGTTRDPATAHAIRMATLPAHAIARCADRLHVHIDGGCVGSGLEMAAFAARITASRSAWFQLPELAMGIIPGAGGCVSLTRRIGRVTAARLILSGRRFSAQAALDCGLIDAIVDD